MEPDGEVGQAQQHRPEQAAQHHLGAHRSLCPGLAEHGDVIGDGLDTGQCAATRRERLEQHQDADGGRGLGNYGRVDAGVGRRVGPDDP